MPTLPATTVDFFLAGLQAFMIRSGQGTHWAVTMLRLRGKPDDGALDRAWQEIHAQHPMLGARLRRVWRGWRLVWETPGPVAAPPVVWQPPGDSAQLNEIILDRLMGKTGPGDITSPLWMEVVPLDDDNGPHVVLLTWRHALLDGTGVNLLLEKLAAGGCDRGPPILPEVPPLPLGQVFQKARPLMQRLHAMTAVGCLSAWSKSAPPPGPPCFALVELSSEESQAAFARLRAACGDFLQMPFHAAVAARAIRLLHELRGWRSPEIHLQLPFQTRGRSRDLLFGNHMGTLPLFIEAAVLETMDSAVSHLLETYREAMKQEMHRASDALMTLSAHLPVAWFIPAVRMTNRGEICSLFHSHTGSFLPGRNELAGAGIDNVVTIPSVCTPPGLGIFCSDHAGRMTVTLAWRGEEVSEAEVQALSRQIRADLTGEADV